MRQFKDHPNIISLEGTEVVAMNNPASSVVSRILIVMPYYSVSIYRILDKNGRNS